MNSLLIILSTIVYNFFVLCLGEDTKKFIVFANHEEASEFYPRIRESGAIPIELETDFDAKKQLCEDILSNYEFRRKDQRPYKPNIGKCFICLSSSFNYPVESIRVLSLYDDQEFDEMVIICLAQGTLKEKYRYYITKEHNLSTSTSENYMPGRFIFYKNTPWSLPSLYGLVELPGEDYVGPGYDDIERLYLERRKRYDVQNEYYNVDGDYRPSLSFPFPKDDPLCGLNKEKKIRICNAVFNSSYFKGKITISSAEISVYAYCGLEIVFFQTAYGIANAGAQKIGEWMLKCSPHWDFFLGHAYQVNQILVYFREKESGAVFPEKVIAKVRLNVPSPIVR